MIIQFDIPNNKLQRLAAALDREGFVFNPELGTTQAEQRKTFFRKLTIRYWQSLVFNHERQEAINAEPNDSAFQQSQRFIGLDDIIDTEV